MPPGFIVSSMISVPAKLMVVTPPAQLIGSGGVKRRVPAQRECVPLQLPGDGGFRPTECPGNGPHRPPRGPQNADLVSFVLRQMRIGSHGNTP